MSRLRVLRVHHDGGSPAARARDLALVEAGIDVTLIGPRNWPGAETIEDVPSRLLQVRRPGDVNRHAYRATTAELAQVVHEVGPDLIDIHEEPVSVAARQWLRAAGGLPVVMYSAQNVDKRWPPPFAQYERAALRRVSGFYPCSRQAAAVLRHKGFQGAVHVLPLGVDLTVHRAGSQRLPSEELVLGLVGRLEPEKGILDAVRVLAALQEQTPTRLLVVGEGRVAAAARHLAGELAVADRCVWLPWCSPESLAVHYRRMHVVLVPSRATTRWVEQFGRVVTEGRANGAVPVAYASGSLPEVVGSTGVVVPEGDVDAMAAAVVSLVHDPNHWSDLRRRGLEQADDLGWVSTARAQLLLYESVARGGAWPPGPIRGLRRWGASEFGPTAVTPGGSRPFALPVLRSAGHVPRVLGRLVDALTHQR